MFLDSIFSIIVGIYCIVLFLFYNIHQYFNLPFNIHTYKKKKKEFSLNVSSNS